MRTSGVDSTRSPQRRKISAEYIIEDVTAGGGRGYSGLRSYLRFTGTFKGPFAFVVLLMVLSSGAISLLPIFVGRFIESLSNMSDGHSRVYFFAAALIGCNIIHDLAWRATEIAYLRLLVHRGYEYEDLLFERVIGQRYPYFIGKFTGKISSYVATLGREFRDMLNDTCFNYVEHLVRIPAVVLVMFAVNVWSGVIFLVAVLMMALLGGYTSRLSFKAEKTLADEISEMDGHAIDIIANFVSVKAFRQERIEVRKVRRQRRDVIVAARRAQLQEIFFWALISFVVRYLLWPVSILLNLHFYLSGELSLAQFVTFLSAVVMFSDFMWAVTWELQQLNLRLARTEEAYEYLFGGRAGDIEASGPTMLAPFAEVAVTEVLPVAGPGRLELCGLSFAYPDNVLQQVLSGIDLAIEPGEKIGIVGRSGSGKTTLIKLLLGYYPVPPEMVRVDGQPTPNEQLAARVSYVPQDTALFHRSIRDNITYGAAGEVSREQVEAAATRAHAHSFITGAPQGYDTLVGERGIRLSTGQRQRIAIARAFLDDKPILILDEATSALDSESEVLVQAALEELWSSKTVIAVAHRLSTLLNMDRIVVLDDGHIVEHGSHSDLLALGGRYRSLWDRQSGGMVVVD